MTSKRGILAAPSTTLRVTARNDSERAIRYLYRNNFPLNLLIQGMITKEQVLDALRYVEDPDLKKDLVTLNMIEDLAIDGKNVSFSVVLTTPACPMKTMIHNACVNAIFHYADTHAQLQP